MQQEEIEKQIAEKESNDASGKKKDKKKIWKYIANISLVLIITILSVVLTFYKSFDTIIADLKMCDWKWIGVVALILVLAVCIRSLILFLFARLYTRNYHFHQALAVDQVGVFYNAVTPGASGGQFMQAYTYKKQGVPISSAVSCLAMYSIVFQSVLILYGTLSFIIKYDFIIKMDAIVIPFFKWSLSLSPWVLTIIGFLLNVGVILIVLLMAYWHGFHNFIMGPVIGLLNKMHIIMKPDKTRENLRIQVENFKLEFKRLITNIPFTLLVAFLFFCYITAKYSIPYFIGIGLGSEHVGASYFWDSVFLSNYHQMVTGLIPVPGSAGVSEFFFSCLFSNNDNPVNGFYYVIAGYEDVVKYCTSKGIEVPNPVFDPDGYNALVQTVSTNLSSSMCKAALLLWRSITFILPIIAAGITTAFYRSTPKQVNARGEIANGETFVSLQKETYVERSESAVEMANTIRLNREEIVAKLKSTSPARKKNTSTKKHGSGGSAKKRTMGGENYDVINVGDDEEDDGEE